MTATQNAHAIRISSDALDHLFRQARTYNAVIDNRELSHRQTLLTCESHESMLFAWPR